MESNKIRQTRKLDHLNLALQQPDRPMDNGFDDIQLVHQALPGCDLNDIDLSLTWLGKAICAPFLINAITGGADETETINASLAMVAKETGVGMAVGSQTAGLLDANLARTYKVARLHNPSGLILANLGATATADLAIKAVEMIEANGLQIHLNILQELVMPEGERTFSGILNNIEKINRLSPVPVIVKEVGFGVSKETALQLYNVGVRYIDIGGFGGTNFVAIENSRFDFQRRDTFLRWGIPTASSLLEVNSLQLPIEIIASGGLRTGVEICKALRLGATMIGIAGSFLKTLIHQGEDSLKELILTLIEETKITMLLTNSHNYDSLRKIPMVITGNTLEWIKQRNLNY